PAPVERVQRGTRRMREGEIRGIGLQRHGLPHWSPLPSEQRDGGRADGAGLSVPRSTFRGPSLAEPPPRDLPREAEPVEPQRVVLPHPGGQAGGIRRTTWNLVHVERVPKGVPITGAGILI